jgi:hypothetical protein
MRLRRQVNCTREVQASAPARVSWNARLPATHLQACEAANRVARQRCGPPNDLTSKVPQLLAPG